MVPCGPSINSVWFLPVQTALFSTLYDLVIPALLSYQAAYLCPVQGGRRVGQFFNCLKPEKEQDQYSVGIDVVICSLIVTRYVP